MVNRPIPDWMRPAFERSEHPFYLWEELMKTPECLSSVMTEECIASIREAAASLRGANAVHLVGCGSSYFSAIAGTYVFHEATNLPAQARNAFEFAAYPPARLAGSAVIGISHTGGTAAVIDSLSLAAKYGAVTIGLTDVADSPIVRVSDYVLLGGGGREKPLPKTRSYTTSLLKHCLLTVETGDLLGKDVSVLRSFLEKSPETAQNVLENHLYVAREIAFGLDLQANIYLFGAGPNTATVLDGALKLQETVQAQAYAFELEEGMHGPWVTMNPGDLVVVYAVRGPSFEKAKNFVSAISSLGVTIWALTDEPSGIPGATYEIQLPQVPELISPLYSVLPVYQFVYYLALARGVRPDSMRLTDDRYLEARLKLPR